MARVLGLLVLVTVTGVAVAQNYAIQWRTDPAAAVNEAVRTQRPLLVYVRAAERDDDSRIDRDQKRAFRDPAVLRKMRNFIPLQLSRAQHRDKLEQFGFSKNASMEIRFVSPDGEQLDALGAGAITDPDTLARKMSVVLEAYGRHIFNKEIKPIFDKTDARPDELKPGVRRIGELRIKSADKPVIDLLMRGRLDAAAHALAYETLAALSTQPAVSKLLEWARGGDAAAAKALEKCTPAGAELMLAELKPEVEPFDYLVYKTVTRICKVPQPKPERYFENSPVPRKTEEAERVKKLVADAAQVWRAENE